MKKILLVLVFIIINYGCSTDDSSEQAPELTVSELLVGEWQLVERQAFWANEGEPHDELSSPEYNSIIEFRLEDIEVINDPLWGDYIENGEIHFIYGDILGLSETPSPEYWSYWPFSWDEFEVSLIARVDDMSFPRSFTINQISANNLTLIFHYFWFDTFLYYQRHEN